MPYVAPATVITATTITTAWGNSVKAATDFLANPPVAVARRAAVQGFTTSTWTKVTFDTEVLDTDSMFTTASGDRFTIVTAGIYDLSFSMSFASNGTGIRFAQICKSASIDTNSLGRLTVSGSGSTDTGMTITVTGEPLIAGDAVSFQVWQNSGGLLNTDNAVQPCRARVKYAGRG